jgi:hypothetical protein
MLDYLGIAKQFNLEGIRYVVVGGVAVNMHGVPRMTYDLDLIVDMEDGNLRRLMAILRDWGFRPKVPVDIMDIADAGKRTEWIADKHMKAFNLVNEKWALSEIDIIIDSPVDWATASANSLQVDVSGVRIPIASIGDLVLMKRAAGRPQDEADIRYLTEVDEDG